jgi:hypothetical protein
MNRHEILARIMAQAWLQYVTVKRSRLIFQECGRLRTRELLKQMIEVALLHPFAVFEAEDE